MSIEKKNRKKLLNLRARRKAAKKLAKLIQSITTDFNPKVTRTGQLSV